MKKKNKTKKSKSVASPHFGKQRQLQMELMKTELYQNNKSEKVLRKKQLINDYLKRQAKMTDRQEKEEKNKRLEKKHAAIDYSLVGGRRYVNNNSALKKLAKNGRDYSYRHPVIENASLIADNRTKEQQEAFDLKHKPHIIYTPMGGQNKKY
ncbi:MAG: hypothetical protein IKH37_00880 [Prevotella sp.]|nr:hypothetical protein [Prevotella sp.]